MVVARKCLCQEFVLTGGIDWKSLKHIFQHVKRIDYTRFRFPESVEIDVVTSTIQYSRHKMTAVADAEKQGGSEGCSTATRGPRDEENRAYRCRIGMVG